MEITIVLTKRKIISFLLLCGLLTFCTIAVIRSLHKDIEDPFAPLAGGNIEAMFYVEESGGRTCIGDGIINNSSDILYNESAVKAAIVSAPDYSSYLPSNMTIKWTSIRNSASGVMVIGSVTSIDAVDEAKYSVRQFGAIGDGVTDDTLAFKAALKKAAGGELYIPAGKYLITSVLSIPSDIKVYGDGENSIIIACAGYAKGADLLKIYNRTNVTLNKICLSGNSAINDHSKGYNDRDGIHLLDIWSSSNVSITECSFVDNIYCAVRMILDCNNMYYANCKFLDVDCGISALGSGSIDTLTVENCYFDGHKNSESISLFGQGHYSNIVIDNNTIKNKYQGHGIYAGANKGTVSNLTVSNNKLFDDCVGITIGNAQSVKVFNNSFIIEKPDAVDSGKAFEIKNCSDISIYKNTITNSRMQGLWINGCSNAKVYGNVLTDCGYLSKDHHFLDVRGECSGIEIYDNQLIRNDTTLSPYTFVSHSTGDVTLKDNTISNGKILLYTDSAGMTIQGNDAPITDMSGKKHTIIK